MSQKLQRILWMVILISQLFVYGQRQATAQNKEIAVTFDDLPLNGPPIEINRLRAMTENLLGGLAKNQIPAVGFVNESLLYRENETDARIAILKSWSDAGLELGNHTFSHLGFKNASLAEYEDDFVRGEAVTKILLKQKSHSPRYFRHPFLQMGTTLELENSFEDFIAARGYRIAPVTIDTMDWMFLAAYAKALKEGDQEMLKKVSDDYLRFAFAKFDSSERITNALFNRQIKHILLLHANQLNADNLEALIKMMKDKGYRFITLEEALKDPVYKFPAKYLATSDWLGHWAYSLDKKFETPSPPEYIQKIYNGK